MDTPYRASFQVSPDLPNLKRVDWAYLQDHFAAGLPGEIRIEAMKDINATLETMTKAIQDVLRVQHLIFGLMKIRHDLFCRSFLRKFARRTG